MSHSYEKHTWSVGEVITKALIDRMETGIDNAVDKSGDTITYKLDFVKNSSPQQKGTVLWDEASGYGRMKIQQYAQTPTLDSDGFYKNDDPNHTVADTYSFPKKAADAFTAANYNIFTSKGASRGIAWFNNEDTTEGNNGILNYLVINDNAKGKVLKINSNGEPIWAIDNTTSYPYTEYTSTTNNGITTATFTINNRTVWNDGRIARIGNVLQFFTRNAVPIVDGDQNVVITDLTTKYNNAIIVGDYTNQFVFREHHITGEGIENYYLPAPTNENPPKQDYDILTTKNLITIAQGGTSAATAQGARQNLQVPYYYGNNNDSNDPTFEGNVYIKKRTSAKGLLTTDGTIESYGEIQAHNIIYTGMPAPSYNESNGTITSGSAHVPAYNFYPDVVIKDGASYTTARRSIGAIRSRYTESTSADNYSQMGTKRDIWVAAVTYKDEYFTFAAKTDTFTLDNKTYTYGNNIRGVFNFHLPLCKFSDWQKRYANAIDNGNIQSDEEFSPAFEILTSKNYRFIAGSYFLTTAINLSSTNTSASFIIEFQDTDGQSFNMPDNNYSAYVMLTDRNKSNTSNSITINGPYAIYTTNHNQSQLLVTIKGFGNTITLPINTKIDYFVGYGTPCSFSNNDED